MFDSCKKKKKNSSKTNGKGQNNCFSRRNIRYYLTENLVLLLFKIYKISLSKQLFRKLDLASFLTVTIDENFLPNLLLLEVWKIFIISLFFLLVSCAIHCCCYCSNDFFYLVKFLVCNFVAPACRI